MVVVPDDRFTMGSPDSEPERHLDEDQIPVAIARPFADGIFAVTFDEWKACVADGAAITISPATQIRAAATGR
jgi:formylglycine-generating enzyme required for sulfatase activity